MMAKTKYSHTKLFTHYNLFLYISYRNWAAIYFSGALKSLNKVEKSQSGSVVESTVPFLNQFTFSCTKR